MHSVRMVTSPFFDLGGSTSQLQKVMPAFTTWCADLLSSKHFVSTKWGREVTFGLDISRETGIWSPTWKTENKTRNSYSCKEFFLCMLICLGSHYLKFSTSRVVLTFGEGVPT